jgi:hypothetical protein
MPHPAGSGCAGAYRRERWEAVWEGVVLAPR